MNDKENRVRQGEISVRIAETKVREAKSALDHGYAKARAEMEREYDRLKLELERAHMEVERERAHLEMCKTELALGYET